MKMIRHIAWKEFRSYFLSPEAYAVIAVFLVLSALYGFMISQFLPNDDASLAGFLDGHRWVYLILIPALGMQMWTEEQRSGTLEMLFTLPVREWECVAGKFLAGLAVVATALALTFPAVITVCYLGSPDIGMILCGYLGSLLLAAAYLGLCSLASALSRNQIISYVVGATACLSLNLFGLQSLSDLFTGRLTPLADFFSAVGVRGHYQPFLRGILDTRDLYYFLAVTAFGLFGTLSVLWIRRSGGISDMMSRIGEKMCGKKRRDDSPAVCRSLIFSGRSLILLVWTLLACGFLFSHWHIRFDLTENNMFTLSEDSRKIIRAVDQPVEIRFYLSRDKLSKWTAVQGYAKRVEDLLNEYQQTAPERVRVLKMDVKPLSSAEESAAIDGINGVQLEDVGRVWFGISVCSGKNRMVIPDLAPLTESRLEYELTRAILEVTHPKLRRISVISPLPLGGLVRENSPDGSLPPWALIRTLRNYAQVKILPLSSTTSDLDDAEVVVVAHPAMLPQRTLYAIDQFLMRGGKVLMFIDPNCYYTVTAQHKLNLSFGVDMISSDAGNLLSGWGIPYSPDVVAADMTLARIDPQINQRLPCILEPSGDNGTINRTHPATRQLRHLMFWFGGFISGPPPPGVTETVLVKTTGDAAVCSKYIAHKHEEILMRFKPDQKPKTLAAWYQGRFRSAYGKTPSAMFEVPRDGHQSESDSAAALAVVCDADMLFDAFCHDTAENPLDPREKIKVQINDNQAFVLNLIDAAADTEGLTALRGERSLRRPFVRLHRLKSELEQKVMRSEKELIQELYAAEATLQELRESRSTQEKELDGQQKKVDALIKELSNINAYRNQLATMENKLFFWNVAAVPLALLIFGAAFLTLTAYRRRAR